MRSRILAFSMMAVVGVSASAAQSKKVYCSVAKGVMTESSNLGNGQAVVLDISKIQKEGDGAFLDLGTVGKVDVNLEVYLSDKAGHELSLQLNETNPGGASAILASTTLPKSGMTKLVYRSVGDTNLVMVSCGLLTDQQIKSIPRQ